ncbi:rRNA maturation RNase YbeY [Sphingorhabdus sp.]|jgi:probable rRNA maturation factor|uniref:rRNA maturation RNase YbeY n=1 Tax=Sphingorhabdus sp. TaxID=1902408 RepID=UPI002C31A32F|nr:rRNA maturation RNase YbeY [Sphingorhabdus sp.]HMT40919.1 rRNA maturation RNase YbeY [Sphingorhabdus sp.]
MLEVDIDRTRDWDGQIDWDRIAEDAVKAAFSVSSHGDLADAPFKMSISIQLSDDQEVHELNRNWRGKDKPTNVLSFPMLESDELAALLSPLPFRGGVGGGAAQPLRDIGQPHPNPSPEGEGLEVLLGDMILAYGVCASEAEDKAIPLTRHVSHLIVHGTLHLLGLDHIDEAEAEHMEALEVKALASLGIANPYSDH